MAATLQRLRERLHEDGLGGMLRRVPAWVGRALSNEFDQVWYVLDLGRVNPRPLAEGYELMLVSDDDVGLITELVDTVHAENEAAGNTVMDLPSFTPQETQSRRAQGAQTWLVVKGREPAFACWIFPRKTPVISAVGGELELPAGAACLEDSVTGGNHRGKGIAPAAWTAIAERLPDQGFDVLITKVAVENVPSRKAVEKAGFVGAAIMHHRRRGPVTRVSLTTMGADLTEPEQRTLNELRTRLSR
jgi:L-amino acid N-acyltransferase YncA